MSSYEIFISLITGFNYVSLAYFLSLNTAYLILTVIAFRSLRHYISGLKTVDFEELIRTTGGAPPITLLVPAYNEEATCVASIRALLLLKYPNYEIFVINDGSTDATLETLTQAYELSPAYRAKSADLLTAQVRGVYRSERFSNLWVIDKENGGKADALNVGINHCRTPLFCSMDADTLLERDSLIRIVRPFLEDARTVAAGGIIRIVNDCKIKGGVLEDVRMPRNIWAKLQVLEYLRAFMAGRLGWDAMEMTLIISGAFGIFKRSTVVEAGGYYQDTVGEDMELIVRLHKHCRDQGEPYRISYIADPVAWTECPESLKILGRQRDRWQRGLYESLMRHREMLFNPKYGRIGMVVFPYFFILEMLGPIVELIGYAIFFLSIILGVVSGAFIFAFLMASIIFGVVLSIAAVALEELSFRRYPKVADLFQLFGLAVIENFGYRQLNAYWRIKGLISGMRKKKGWGKMERRGFRLDATS